METSDKPFMEGLCQSYRTPNDQKNTVSTAVRCDRLVDLNDKETKLDTPEAGSTERRKKLAFSHVIARNIVHVIGIPAVLADEEILERKEYFGQYGEISEVSILKKRGHSPQVLSAESSFSVYVKFFKAEDAMRCIQSMNGYILNGKMLKASFRKEKSYETCLEHMGIWEDNRSGEQLYTQCRRRGVLEANWENSRVDSCESDGDNFSCTINKSRQGHICVQNRMPPWKSFKRQKVDAGKVNDEVYMFQETETSSVELTSAITASKEAMSHVASPADSISHDFASLGDKIIKLDSRDHEFMMVQSKFYTGLGLLASFAIVKCISKNCHRSTSGQARLQAFKRQEEITQGFRGDSNVRDAWHACSKAGISVIVLHGFGQTGALKDGPLTGIGVYLAPGDNAHVSAMYSDIDENGVQHMVLCRVIMGNMEQVEQGSQQFHPTNEDYDTGVDDLYSPTRYIVWSTHMNTHILPEYIVTFKLLPPWNDNVAASSENRVATKSSFTGKEMQDDDQVKICRSSPKTSCTTCIPVPESLDRHCLVPRNTSRMPRSPWMSFPMLFISMKTKLSEAEMYKLQRHYLQFKVGKMPRDQLIKVVRSIAGDRLLSDSIRNMQAKHASLLGRGSGDQGLECFANRDP